MSALEVIPRHGLFVVRQGIEPALANDMQEEWSEFLTPELLAALCMDGTSVSGLCDSENPVDIATEFFSTTMTLDKVVEFSDLPATARAMHLLDLVGKGSGSGLTINSQPPETEQDFHMDNRVAHDRVVIIHGGDGGAYDYCPSNFYDRRNPKSAKSIEMNAGDVLISTLPYLYHRGRNRGDQHRYTFAHTVDSKEPFVRPRTPHGLDSLGREIIDFRS